MITRIYPSLVERVVNPSSGSSLGHFGYPGSGFRVLRRCSSRRSPALSSCGKHRSRTLIQVCSFAHPLQTALKIDERPKVSGLWEVSTHYILYKQPHYLAMPGKEIEITTSKLNTVCLKYKQFQPECTYELRAYKK